MKLISIIVPVFNSASTIGRCLDSILGQNYPDIEVIVINDGSRDNSLDIIANYENKYSNIKVFTQKNSGVSVARNFGIQKSVGDYIMFVDSDDSLQQNACSSLVKAFTSDVDLVLCGLNVYKDDSLIRSPRLKSGIYDLRSSIDYYWYLRSINLGPCNKLYRKDLIIKLFDTSLSLGEDCKFVIDYMRNVSKIAVLSECLYNVFLDNTGSLNRKYRKDRLEQLVAVRKYEAEFLSSYYPKVVDHRIYDEFFLDLHVILTDIIRRKIAPAKVLIKENILKCNYNSIYKQCCNNRCYYTLFKKLVCSGNISFLYYFLKFRIFIERFALR